MAFPEDRDRELQRESHGTMEFGDELIGWLGDANPQRVAAGQPPIPPEEEFQLLCLRRKAANLYRSSLVPPAVAVYGPSQVGKSLFVGRVLEPEQPQFGALGPDAGRGPPVYFPGLSFEFDINPHLASQEATALVTRFTTKDRFERTAHPDYPVLVRGLSRSERLCVLARGYRSECRPPKGQMFGEAELDSLFEEVSERFQGEKVDREWRMDIVDVYSYLKRPDGSPYKADESCINGLLSCYPLTDQGYVNLAARLCWGNLPELTDLFLRITRFLDKISRNGRDGMLLHWMAARFLLDSQHKAQHESKHSRHFPVVGWNDIVTREVDGWYVLDYDPGRGPPSDSQATIQSAMLEMVIPVLPDRLNAIWREVLAHVDILDIPGMVAGGEGEGRTDDEGLQTIDDRTQLQIVKRGKVFYLFQRYIDELQAQTLLMLFRGGNINVRGYLRDYLYDWGVARYGKDAWPEHIKDKDRDHPALFVGMTGIDEEFRLEPPVSARYDARLNSIVDDTFKGVLKNFGGPGQKFTNFYPLRYPGTWDKDAVQRKKDPETSHHWDAAGPAFLSSSKVREFVADATRKWESAMRDGDGGTSLLAAGFRQVTSSARKQNELDHSRSTAESQLAQLGRSWAIDPDSNVDRDRRVAAARGVLDWVASEPEYIFRRVQALEESLCFTGGDVLPIADFADIAAPGRQHPQPIEKRLPEAVRGFLREWSTSWAPQRWKDFTTANRDGGTWLSSEKFDAMVLYLVDYLTSDAVLERLCRSLLTVVKLAVSNKADRRYARRKFVRLVLNDYVITPGDPFETVVDSTASKPPVNGDSYGLMTPFVQRWQARLPAVLAAGAGNKVSIPAGNDELIAILKRYGYWP